MKHTNKTKRRSFIILMGTVLLLIILVLTYYQLLYKSERVDKNFVKFERLINDHGHSVTAVRFTNNDSFIVSGSVDKTIKIHDRQSGKLVQSFSQPEGITYLDLSPNGDFITTSSYDGKIRLWSVSNASLVKEFQGHSGTAWTVTFSPDGNTIASSGDDRLIKLWDIKTGALIRTLTGHSLNVWSVRFSPDGTQLASCSFDRSFKLWNVNDGKLLVDNKQHRQAIVDIAYSNNGKMIVTTSDDKTIRIWNVQDGSLLRILEVPEHIQAAAFSPDDRLLMTGGRDKPTIGEFLQTIFGDSESNKGVSARLWDVRSGALLHTFVEQGNDVNDVAFSHNGKWIVTASADKSIGLWRLHDNR
jgi:WD40 repeat protein